MNGHSAHEAHPGYSPRQVLKDQCAECLERSGDIPLAIGHMDRETFGRAWKRAVSRNRDGLPDISDAEAPLLDVLWALAAQFERRGFPLGECPEAGLLTAVTATAPTTAAPATTATGGRLVGFPNPA